VIDQRASIERGTANSERHQRREWVAERIGWLLMGAILLLGLLGFLGPGLLSSRTITGPDGQVRVKYDATLRHLADAKLRIRIAKASSLANRSKLRVLISSSFADQTKLESISSPPEQIELGDPFHAYIFPVARLDNEALITISYRPEVLGWLRYQIAVGQSPPIAVAQFVCP
jgi:hypothetical protein